MKKGLESHHVIYRGDEWVVKKAGAQGVGQAFQTKDEAARYARELAQSQGTSLFIHRANGTIGEAVYLGGG